MFRHRLIVIACLLTLPALARAQQQIDLAPIDGVLILANGQTIHGKIARAGDQYIIAIDTGEIRIKAADVDLVCRSLEEAYERKRAAITNAEAHEHLELALWCVRYKLFNPAAREISVAMQLDPTHPKIPLVERRLQSAMTEVDDAPPEATSAKSVSNEELDRLVRSLPEGTVDTFTHSVQPLLINSCTTTGCHGPNATNRLSLFRIPMGRTPSRRLTQRNLHAAIAQVDMSNPAASPLLTVPLKEHGGRKTPLFTSHEMTQYRQLVAWVYRVSRSSVPLDARPQQTVKRPDERGETLLQNSPARPNASLLDTAVVDNAPAKEGEAPAKSATAAAAKNDAAFKPRDPFDADVFNRRYHGAP
ncbi:MAG: hypothetical protein JSS27_06130 [Planctomycetes bacterium]|nr:hypothetical protein [Planctomycetota bacterium]